MSEVSLQLPDSLMEKVAERARCAGVTLSEYLACALTALVEQEDTKDMLSNRLAGKSREAIRGRHETFMAGTQDGEEPSLEEIDAAMGEA